MARHGKQTENTRSTLNLAAPDDCELDIASQFPRDEALTAGANVRHETTWTVQCANRSFHDFELTAQAALHEPDIHLSDPNSDNNSATATSRTEVFETVDLETTLLGLQCSEREHNTQASECTATVRITNNGSADRVITDTDLRFTVEAYATPRFRRPRRGVPVP